MPTVQSSVGVGENVGVGQVFAEPPQECPPEPPPHPPDQTLLLHNEEETFALGPVDASALKGSGQYNLNFFLISIYEKYTTLIPLYCSIRKVQFVVSLKIKS